MSMMYRADLLLLEKGKAQSRAEAQRLIKTRHVYYGLGGQWTPVIKPSQKIPADSCLKLTDSDETRYVSRGGLKLEAAVKANQLSLAGGVALDVGQSTGGFTDCLIQAGVDKVVGVDVGHDQLSPKLKTHPKVICLEGINARSLPVDLLLHYTNNQGYDWIVMDVSFISQKLIVPGLAPVLREEGGLISLVKPQFEVGKKGIGKGGIVRDEALLPQVEASIREAYQTHGFEVLDYRPSPITGGDGNREFLLYARRVKS